MDSHNSRLSSVISYRYLSRARSFVSHYVKYRLGRRGRCIVVASTRVASTQKKKKRSGRARVQEGKKKDYGTLRARGSMDDVNSARSSRRLSRLACRVHKFACAPAESSRHRVWTSLFLPPSLPHSPLKSRTVALYITRRERRFLAELRLFATVATYSRDKTFKRQLHGG